MQVTNKMVEKLPEYIKEEIREYLIGDNLSHRSFVSNIVNSSGPDNKIAELFDIEVSFLKNLKSEIEKLV